jgi:hypothetical protein
LRAQLKLQRDVLVLSSSSKTLVPSLTIKIHSCELIIMNVWLQRRAGVNVPAKLVGKTYDFLEIFLPSAVWLVLCVSFDFLLAFFSSSSVLFFFYTKHFAFGFVGNRCVFIIFVCLFFCCKVYKLVSFFQRFYLFVVCATTKYVYNI